MRDLLPRAASAHAAAIDGMLDHVHLMVLLLFVGWAIYFAYVLIRFRHGRQPKPMKEGARGRVAMVVVGVVMLAEAVVLVGDALPVWFERTSGGNLSERPTVIRVVAEQFAWNVHYAGVDGSFGSTSLEMLSPTNPLGLDRSSAAGRDDLTFLSEIHVPVNRPVVIELTSKDVIHSFGVPAMRVKQDAMPGVRVPISFVPTVQGEFEIVCSQLCGLAHHRMRGTIKVESDEEYAKFLADQAKSQAR